MVDSPLMASTRREETEAAILHSARVQFSRRGFEQVGVRDVADAAGVNAALVIRYFGTKEALFEQAVTREVDLAGLFEVPRERLGEALVRYIIGKKDADSLLALLRSAGSQQAGALLRRSLEAQFITPLAAAMRGDDRALRAGLVAAQLLGVALMREVVMSEPLASADDERLAARYAPLVQRLLDES